MSQSPVSVSGERVRDINETRSSAVAHKFATLRVTTTSVLTHKKLHHKMHFRLTFVFLKNLDVEETRS